MLFFALLSNSYAQGTNYAGNWETTTPVAQYNNTVVRLQISSTASSDVFVIVNADKLKRKYDAKYNSTQDRLYTSLDKKQIYFKYVAATDLLECYKTKDDTKVYELTRY